MDHALEHIKNNPELEKLGFSVKNTEEQIKENPHTFPLELKFIWDNFQDIARSRTSNGYGPNPLQWSEIQSWMFLTQTPFLPWHVRAIKSIDDTFLICWAEKQAKNKK